MKIEIVEFYELSRDDEKHILKGTMHIYLVDLNVDIRGVFVSRKKNSWFFKMPHNKAIDPETKEPVFYPVFVFCDLKMNRQLKDAIKTKGRKFIMEKYGLNDSKMA